MKKVLLGSTALLTAGLMAGPVAAQEVNAGGALDITITGFSRFIAAYGDLKEKFGGNEGAYDFRNDNEVIFRMRGQDESTGIRYGATIELEADTSSSGNADETWIFMSGNFGEFRFGDEDGAQDNLHLGGASIAAGTGGVDGTIVDTGAVFAGTDTGDSTKAIYYSPEIAGFQLGLSFTPSTGGGGQGANLKNTDDGGADDVFEGGIAYTGEFGDFGIKAAVGGYMGHINNTNDDDFERLDTGLVLSLFGFEVAGGHSFQKVGEDEDQFYDVAVAANFGPASVSVNWGDCYDCDGSEPNNLVVGATVGLFPGIALDADLSFFDEDRGGDDDGVLGVVRLGVSF